jgi:hypothetical protein
MEVYPLVRQLAPGLTLQAWQRHAGLLLRRSAGAGGMLLVRRATHRFACGMCSFQVGHDLRHGRILMAEDLLVMTSLGANEARASLVQGIEQIAVARRCRAVRWLLSRPPECVADMPRSAMVWTKPCRPSLRLVPRVGGPP